jgi:predicted nucleotidyltransferase
MKNLSKDQILTLLRSEDKALRDQFGVISIGLFGSFAKDRQTDDSDIDLLVEFEAPRFDHVVGLQIYLEDRFGKKVGIVRKGAHLSKRFTSLIEKDIVYVQ